MGYYPTISQDLLEESIAFAAQHTDVSQQDRDIIMHARKSLLFSSDAAWIEKRRKRPTVFDVRMGRFDGAETCELVGTYALSKLADKFDSDIIGLSRDDGLAVLRDATGCAADRARKEICRIFKDLGLKIPSMPA